MSELVIHRGDAGTVEVRLEGDTVWLRQEQLSQLFGRDRTVIGRHLRNVFAEGELDRVKAPLQREGVSVRPSRVIRRSSLSGRLRLY